jgi:putative oxidoreductase
MFKRLMWTDDNVVGLILRLTLGIVFFPHGAQKMLGWFGGHGFSATMAGLTKMGLPAAIVFLVIIIEFFGSIALILGFLGRLAALGIGIVMLGAIATVHLHNGFFMNWSQQAGKGEGFEYHLLVLGIVLALLVTGSGRWSIDRSLSNPMPG